MCVGRDGEMEVGRQLAVIELLAGWLERTQHKDRRPTRLQQTKQRYYTIWGWDGLGWGGVEYRVNRV